MPRPTAAQLAYGSATVVLATLAMLSLSGVTSGIGIAVIALVALGLGVTVSVKVARPSGAKAAPAASEARIPTAAGVPGPRVPARPEIRAGAGEHSLRR